MRRNTIVLLIVLLIILIGVGYFATNPDQGEQLLVDLGLTTPVPEGYTASGMLEAEVYALSAEYGGRVEEVLISEGEAVTQGQALATLDGEALESQIAVSQAQLDTAQALLDMLNADPREVDLAVAEAALDQAKAFLEAAEQAMVDADELAPEDLRDEQVALAESLVDQAQAGVDAAEAMLEALQNGPTQADIDSAQAGVDAAAAGLAGLEAMREKLTLRAPIDGVVMDVLILPGELALPGWPAILVADLSELTLTVYIPEGDLNHITVGEGVKVKVDAYPETEFEGLVVFIADQAEFTPRNVQTPDERAILVYAVKITVPNPHGALKPGLPADSVFEVMP